MKPAAFTTLVILASLLASTLCVGIRHFSDERQRTSAVTANRPESTIHVVDTISRPVRQLERSGESPAQTLEMRLRVIMAIANPADRRRALLSLMDGFSPQEWPVAAAALRPVNASGEALEFQFLLEAWAEADPLAAIAWAATPAPGSVGENTREAEAAVFRAWMAKDRDAAYAYLTHDSCSPVSRSNLNLVAVRSLRKDLPALGEFLERIPEGGRAYLIAQEWVDVSSVPVEDLKRWMDSLSPGLRKDVLVYAVRLGLGKAEQKRILLDSYPDDLGPEYQIDLYQAWIRENPAAALASLDGISAGPVHASAVAGAGLGLAQLGRFPEALALARRFPDEIDDSIYAEILQNAGAAGRSQAIEATSGLKNESDRFRELHTQLMFWFSEDPAAAREWLRTHEVPELLRQEYGEK